MSLDLCAQHVARADSDRFAAAMTAPPDRRGALLALYAFNLEVARAPWVTAEPTIAAMRLQWWTDAIAEIYEGRPPRRHEVVTPLAEAIATHDLPRAPFDAAIAARHRDIAPEPHADDDALWAWLDATGGGLTWLAARALGADPGLQPLARAHGTAAAAASLIAALPALIAAHAQPLPPPGGADAVRALADKALETLKHTRSQRGTVPAAVRPAFLAGWQAGATLRAARNRPEAVLKAPPARSEFRRRATLLWAATTGRW
ncbi:phytoene synthase [Rhodobacteraceae bacterium 2CG4]|uniref:Phytoene synthase n=1 Tax=Halovulum marinum TaxID=2662447 RepID=A0A6L5YZE2_9RHOB|nr:squalene/phytoene synthase family protein [Halovulum marinum]MSU89270.1 phytoene synthase [Halovulum marinum]